VFVDWNRKVSCEDFTEGGGPHVIAPRRVSLASDMAIGRASATAGGV
jgi:hypothetical protein